MKRILLALVIQWSLVGLSSPALAQSPELMAAYRQFNALYAQGRYSEAEPFAHRALELGEAEFGASHTNYAILLNNLAGLYRSQGRYNEAEPLLERALAILEEILGPDHPDVGRSFNNLAELQVDQSRYGEAESLHKRSLTIREKALGPDHPDVGQSLNNLAGLYRAQGRFVEAEPLQMRALTIREKALGPDDPDVANSLAGLAALYWNQGRYGEAEPLSKGALAILEKAHGPDHPHVGQSLNNLAALYRAQGRYGEAEPLYKRALAIREKSLGSTHPDVGQSLNSLALLYQSQGRYGEAEPLLKRALAIYEKALGPNHPSVATSLNNLAALYETQGRQGDAEPLHKRALAIFLKVQGPDHPDVGLSLNNLAALYESQGRYGEAEPLSKRSLAILEKTLGPEHPRVAAALDNLAGLHESQGRYSEAEPLYRRDLAIREKTLGPEHPDVATALNNLAGLYKLQGRHDEAEPLLKRALAIWETAVGPDHPEVATALNNLAGLYRTLGRQDLALIYIRRASAIHRGRAARKSGGRSAGSLSEQRKARFMFLGHLLATIEHPTQNPTARGALIGEGFEAGQLANATGAGAAVSRMAARFAAGDDKLAALVRERQDATERWRKLDGAMVNAASRPPSARDKSGDAATRQELSALVERIEGIDRRLAMSFPQFAELSSLQPVPLTEVQALLAKDEALLTFAVWDVSSFVFAIRRDRVQSLEIPVGAEELGEAVRALRKGLDPMGVRSLADIPSFDTTRAFGLYQTLFQPVEHVLEGARHVFVVPDGALQSLPLGVLVTDAGQGEAAGFDRYRRTQWLARKYAMTTLPSVSSLRALRSFAKRARASRPFLGIGDPKLEGATGSGRGATLASLFTARGVADVDSVRQLPSLPETAGELRSLARTLGAGEEALILGTEATETRIKQAALAEHKVLAFATHGLVAGELTGLSESALVLTPPATGSELDDGLLTASEVALLKLDADWVILSACNTAAADGTPGAEGLSGLAKAFFYAGSRALLVSHWPVASEAAVRITTRMLEEAAKPGVGRAEAHRRAMLALIDDQDRPSFAHPLFWAPFVVVGEGGLAGREAPP